MAVRSRSRALKSSRDDQSKDKKPAQQYSDRLGEAVGLACRLHSSQSRKSTNIPYVSHLLAVGALVIEDCMDEETAIAAILHDAVEDQGGLETAKLIRKRFGSRVEKIVLECSDAAPESEDQKEPWLVRKAHHIHKMSTVSIPALYVTAADKLHNVQSTLLDRQSDIGPDVWQRFNADRDDFFWYHRKVLAVLEARIGESRSVRRLRAALEDLAAFDIPAVVGNTADRGATRRADPHSGPRTPPT